MRKNKSPKVKPLAIATPDERREYALRTADFEQKRRDCLAAGAYLDRFGEELREKYGLPTAYDFNLQTGHLTERPVVMPTEED